MLMQKVERQMFWPPVLIRRAAAESVIEGTLCFSGVAHGRLQLEMLIPQIYSFVPIYAVIPFYYGDRQHRWAPGVPGIPLSNIFARQICARASDLTFLVLIRWDKSTYRPFTSTVRKEGFTRRR